MEFELVFKGERADEGIIEFYDVARALIGFQRSLALTTHLVLNGEVITQAPSAVGFELLIKPFEHGSWKSKAMIIFSAGIAVSSAGRDSPLGQAVTSVYDYALSQTMGFHVDYDKTLQEQYYEHMKLIGITEEKIDNLCEKIEANVADMHRPIVHSKTANRASILRCDGEGNQVGPDLSFLTYDYVKQTTVSSDKSKITGHISGYYLSTYKGRIFCKTEGRSIPFELEESARTSEQIALITSSQHYHGQQNFDPTALIEFSVRKMLSSTNKVKRYLVSAVSSPTTAN